MSSVDTKRQLLADLLTGNTHSLRKYKKQQVIRFSFRWVIDARVINEGITVIDNKGESTPMSEQEFDQLPQNAPNWRIVDMTGGKMPPGIDE